MHTCSKEYAVITLAGRIHYRTVPAGGFGRICCET